MRHGRLNTLPDFIQLIILVISNYNNEKLSPFFRFFRLAVEPYNGNISRTVPRRNQITGDAAFSDLFAFTISDDS